MQMRPAEPEEGIAAAGCRVTGQHAAAAHVERLTSNILAMAVTRDVSKLSGWLNARAAKNMPVMSVTLEVSQLEISALKLDKL